MSVYDKIFPPRVLTLPNGKQVSAIYQGKQEEPA